MKKIYSMMLVAAAAMAFVSCQKQENFAPEVSTEEVVLTFASEKPAFDDETKTEWTGETIQWSAGDKISVAYTVNGNWQNASGDASGDAKLYKSEALAEAAETATFNVSASFKGTTVGEHIFYGVYPAPSETGFADAPVATLTVPSIQTPGATSFDGSADLMTGVSVGEFTSRPAKDETISMKWTRLVAHANITLKALNGVTAGETVSSITLTAQEGANLVGSQKVDIIANTVENNNSESNVLELNGGKLTIDASGNIEFWACFLPETLTSLSVVVETNKATYTREITGISKTFKQNARNTLSIKMNEATRVAKEEESWVLVTSNGELTDGTYVLVVKNTNTKNYTGALDTSNGSSSAPSLNQSVKVVDNTLTGVASSVQFDMTVVDGGYKFAVAGQTTNYLYANNTNNGVRIGTNVNNVWTITSDTDKDYAYNFKNNATSRYLGVYETNPDWRCYTSLTENNIKDRNNEIYLYKKQSGPVVPDTTPSITVEETLELTYAESEGTISVNYKNLEALEAAAYSDAECTIECDWLVASWENDAVSYLADTNEGEERTAYIQIYALDADANEYTKVITVTQKAKVDTNFEAGQYWIMATEDGKTKVLTPLADDVSFGYGPSADVTDNRSYAKNAFTFVEVAGGFTIQDASGKYYYADATHKSFQLTTDSSTEGIVWSVTVQNDGTYVLTNVATERTMKYGDGTYTTFGVYLESDADTGVYPTLVKADNPLSVELSSISVSGHKTSFTEGDSFEFGGTVTATYTDDSIKDVTANVSVTEPNMEDGAIVTVSYTEGTITKTFEYTISVKAEGAEVELVTETLDLTSGYSNSEEVSSANGTVVSVEFNKGTNSNTPKWYNTGTAIRVYGGGYFVVSAAGKTITNIDVVYHKNGSNSISVDTGTVSDDGSKSTWIGESSSVKFSVGGSSGHRRIQKITVTYIN